MLSEYIILMKAELMLVAIVFALLIIKISGSTLSNQAALHVIQALLLVNLIAGFLFNNEGSLFADMYHTNQLISFQKSMLNGGVFLISLLFSDWLRKSPHMTEFFILMLAALLGMFYLISSGNFLAFYLALELATIPVAAMVNFDLEKKLSSEAAMKMIMSSAFSSGILLFGISIIYGTTGSINFVEIQNLLSESTLNLVGFILVFTGLAFKLSVVPFHLWTGDVYEGSPAPTASFLSVISKGAVAFILVTVLFKVFASIGSAWYIVLVILSAVTMIIGNLFAIRQQNLKRFLAFSSIAQVGFILVGMTGNSPEASTSVTYFILIYLFSNLAAFAVASIVEERTGRTTISEYKGIYYSNPMLSLVLTLAMFSLAGIPPTAGFFGKLFLITSGASKGTYLFILFAALNMIISLYYYLMVVKAIFTNEVGSDARKISINGMPALGLGICVIGILAAGVWGYIYDYIFSVT